MAASPKQFIFLEHRLIIAKYFPINIGTDSIKVLKK